MDESTIKAIKSYGKIMGNYGCISMHQKHHQTMIQIHKYLIKILPDQTERIEIACGPPLKEHVLENCMKQIIDFKRIAPSYLLEHTKNNIDAAQQAYELYAFGSLGLVLHVDYESILEKSTETQDLNFLALQARLYGSILNNYGKIYTSYEFQKEIDNLHALVLHNFGEDKEALDTLCKPKIDLETLETTLSEIENYQRLALPELLQNTADELTEVKRVCDVFALTYFGLPNNFNT